MNTVYDSVINFARAILHSDTQEVEMTLNLKPRYYHEFWFNVIKNKYEKFTPIEETRTDFKEPLYVYGKLKLHVNKVGY